MYPRTDPDFAGSLRQKGRWRCAVWECDLSACASSRVTSVCMGMGARQQSSDRALPLNEILRFSGANVRDLRRTWIPQALVKTGALSSSRDCRLLAYC